MLRRLSRLATGRRSRWWVIGAWVALALPLAPLQPRLQALAICESEAIAGLRAVFTPSGPACDRRDTTLDIGPETPPSAISEDQRVALTTVLTAGDDTTTVVENVSAIREIVGDPSVHVSGQGGIEADRAPAVEGIDETLLAITPALILVVLLAVYRSPLAAAVPLGVVAVAYLVAAGAASRASRGRGGWCARRRPGRCASSCAADCGSGPPASSGAA